MFIVQYYSILIMFLINLRDRVDKRVDFDCIKSNLELFVL